MLLQKVPAQEWSLVEVDDFDQVVEMVRRLSRCDISVLVETKGAWDARFNNEGTPAYTVSVPHNNKYDLMQVYQSVVLGV